ncbi:hypothetical protein PC119_g13783 [Phytophthora cactorum]|uniref:Uncharacterized protein n=1 Tax=Phytophthora cactorum TaxID=29920 RepID=A0A8T0YY07_9STRA|nr:hypothetical protein PC111_g20779 [Phytophthora cactorum]KAG2854563.1 hypothetical protein PC113_g13208 [Phytophthora cactorum]KAG2895151.1 hypothetical protein PC117_g23313 [Phytophthora cactorum]KAG2991384.1 hypothetical protein PC120_g22723 [Phytophthora cactorum]KAG3009684.1 hypothetical protein PC119_g13783 [Phytophthora cactorum]
MTHLKRRFPTLLTAAGSRLVRRRLFNNWKRHSPIRAFLLNRPKLGAWGRTVQSHTMLCMRREKSPGAEKKLPDKSGETKIIPPEANIQMCYNHDNTDRGPRQKFRIR